MNKILVLGHNGMLGHIVCQYLKKKDDCNVLINDQRWPLNSFKKKIFEFSSQTNSFIINCIGAIPQKVEKYDINTDLPLWLEKNINPNFNCRIIHPGTDCEMDNDDYGISKKKASDFILNKGQFTKIIQSSIIGPELNHKKSLFEWFINNQEEKIEGYSNFYWNGITTLKWVEICYDLIINWDKYKVLTIPATECISKYELLNIMKKIFDKKIKINKNYEIKVNKCLKGNLFVSSINDQLVDLKNYMSKA